MSGNRKEFGCLVRDLRDQGFEVVKAKRNGHLKVRKDGALVTTIPATSSDWRSYQNTLSQLRRAGFKDRSKA